MSRESGRNMALYVGLTEGAAPQKVPYMSEYSVDSSVDKLEVTAGGDKNKTYVVGLPDFSASVSGFADASKTSTTDPLWQASRDGKARHFRLYPNDPGTAATASTVTNKALASNVATLTTSTAHGLSVGQWVTVAGVDATFNGDYVLTAVPSATTLQYTKAAADVASVASGGTVTGPNPTTHFFGTVYIDRSEGAAVAGARTVSCNLVPAGDIYRGP